MTTSNSEESGHGNQIGAVGGAAGQALAAARGDINAFRGLTATSCESCSGRESRTSYLLRSGDGDNTLAGDMTLRATTGIYIRWYTWYWFNPNPTGRGSIF